MYRIYTVHVNSTQSFTCGFQGQLLCRISFSPSCIVLSTRQWNRTDKFIYCSEYKQQMKTETTLTRVSRIMITLRWFLKNKSYRWIFLKLSLNVLYQALFPKYNKNDRSPFSLRDVMGQSYLICACTRANHARYSSVQVTFCGISKHSL